MRGLLILPLMLVGCPSAAPKAGSGPSASAEHAAPSATSSASAAGSPSAVPSSAASTDASADTSPVDVRAEARARGATWLVEPGTRNFDNFAVGGAFLVWNESDVIARVRKTGGPIVETHASGAESLIVDATHAFWRESYGGCPKDDAPDSPRCRPFGYRFMKVALGGGSASVLHAGMPNIPEALAVDDRYLYWFDGTSEYDVKRVRRVDKKGGASTTLADKQRYGFGFQFDGADVFWATYEETKGKPGEILQMPRTGGKPTAVVKGLEKPGAVVVDGGALFWSHAGGVLQTMPKAGGAIVTLGSDTTDPMRLFSFEVDAASVYFVEHASPETRIRRVARAGGEPETLVAERMALSLRTVDDRHVYWIAFEPKNGPQHVRRMAKPNGAVEEIFLAPGASSTSEAVHVETDADAVYLVGPGGGILRLKR